MGRLSSSTIAAGTFNGMTLFEVLKLHPEYFGNKVQNGTLPILVKFIYAKQDLSIQVHPGDAYAMEHEHRNGKTEIVVCDIRGGGAEFTLWIPAQGHRADP